MGSGFDDWVYWPSLQLHSVIKDHTLSSFWMTPVWRISMKDLPLNSDWSLLLSNSKSKSKSHCDWQSVSQSVSLGIEPHLGPMTRYLFLSDSYVLVSVGRPLWREDGSVFCMCRWPLPAQSFSGPSPLGLATVFYSLRFEISLFVSSYDSQGHGGGIRPRLHTGFFRIHECAAFYICHAAEIEISMSNSSPVVTGMNLFSDLLPGNDSFAAIRCNGNMITEPLYSIGRLVRLQHSGLQLSCHNIRYDLRILIDTCYMMSLKRWSRR
jgi:hypothetical protein